MSEMTAEGPQPVAGAQYGGGIAGGGIAGESFPAPSAPRNSSLDRLDSTIEHLHQAIALLEGTINGVLGPDLEQVTDKVAEAAPSRFDTQLDRLYGQIRWLETITARVVL